MVQTRKRSSEAPAPAVVVEQELPSERRAKKTKVEPKAKAAKEVIEIEDDNEDNGDEEDDDEDETPAVDDTIDEWGIEQMDVKRIKDMLRERELSTNGDKKTLSKRIIARLHKEKDPEYKPKPKGRHCKWCTAPMKKRRGLKGPFFGCSTWPACQYTTSLSGYAKPKREHLKGIPGKMQYRDSRWYERMYG